MNTTLQQQDSTIYTLAAQMMAALPVGAAGDADRARIDKALDLVGSVERLARPDLFLVTSQSVADAAYQVHQGQCNCPDASRRDARRCKHSRAVEIFIKLERADAEQSDPTLVVQVSAEDEAIPYELAPICTLCHQPVTRMTKYGECLPCVNAYMFPGDM